MLQDPFLFTGTIGGNIRLGSSWIQDSHIQKAAEEVNLADFIRTLPAGFNEEVRERGSTLSTGQKQLISFARALAHNPKILILDEATSSVDTETEFRVRDALNRMRGQALIQQGDLAGALSEFNKALEVNKNSSLAHYRVAEVFFLQRNYQASANAYRESLNGDGEPRWTEVWCHIQLGKIFDVTGQRERAVNEYRQALQTNDNTQGAQDEAKKYIQKPFEREKAAPAGV